MILGSLMKMVGERPLNAIMDGLPDVRKAKVKEAYQKAVVKCKSGGSGPPKAPQSKAPQPPSKPAASKAPKATNGEIDSEKEKPVTKPPAKAAEKPPPKAAAPVSHPC